jgi:hypothetical protein
VSEPEQQGRTFRFLSRRALEELSALQSSVGALAAPRASALRIFMASRYSTTAIAQREFWLEFAWLDQEYRAAVRRLAQFCQDHREGLRRVTGRIAERPQR